MITIRPADLDFDRELLISMLLQYLTARSDGRRFDWFYRHNPHGQARAWIATDTDTETIVGSGAVMPRRVYVAGKEMLGCVMADFWIHPQYRSLGPAVQLQRACIAGVDLGACGFFYDLPQSSMGVVYKRLGIEPREQLVRLVKPLRTDRHIGKVVKGSLVARGLSAVGNCWLILRDSYRLGGHSGCTVSVYEGACEEEFSALALEVSASYGICVVRSATYLNWRYREHYFLPYEIVTARDNGTLLAYAVFVDTGDYGQIVDVFGVQEPEILSDLIAGVVALLRERGVDTVTVSLLGSHPWIGLFASLGFHPRAAHPVIICDVPRAAALCRIPAEQQWFLTYGDLDY